MNHKLLSELSSFLQKSNISTMEPNISPVTFDEQGMACITISGCVSFQYNDLVEQYNLIILLSFSALDALLDYWHPELPGSFQDRYRALPKNTPIEKVVASVYRFMKTLRNGLVHVKAGIGASKTGVSFTDANKLVDCNKNGLDAVITIVYLFLKMPDLNDKYSEVYLVALHDYFVKELKGKYRDGESGVILAIEDNPFFKLGERKQIEYVVETGSAATSIVVKRYPQKISLPNQRRSDQFMFRWEGKISVLPGEILDESGSFTIDQLEDWKINPDCSLACS